MRNIFLITLLSGGLLRADFHQERDLGFRYVNGKCVNSKGETGLNPGLFGQCADLRGVTAAGFDLSGLDFSGSQMSNSDFQRTNFMDSTFINVNFDNSNLSGVVFDEAIIEGSTFQKARLKKVSFIDAEISNSNFSFSDFTTSMLSYVVFRNSNLKNANFSQVPLDSSVFFMCDASGAIFKNSSLIKAKLTSIDLSGANMQSVRLRAADLSMAKMSMVNLKDADLQRVQLKGADLSKSKIEGADFSFTDLAETNLTGAFYSLKTILPFPISEAIKREMVFRNPDTFAELAQRTYYKVEVEGAMLDTNILKACESEGLRTPCTDGPGSEFVDEKCLDVGFREGGYPMFTLSQAVCGSDVYPSSCKAFEGVFMYMAGEYGGGYGCGVVNGSYCTTGEPQNKYALCVD